MVVRPLMLVAWALVLWGTLLLASVAFRVLTLGPAAAWEAALRLSPGNVVCMAVAAATWGTLAVAAVARLLGSPEG